MSTRSCIGIKEKDGKITAVYSHWDGYPSWNGKILANRYKSLKKVRRLIAHGAISSLNNLIGGKHNFDKVSRQWTTFYHRDRGDDWKQVKPVNCATVRDFGLFASSCGAEYVYVYDVKTNQWLYSSVTEYRISRLDEYLSPLGNVAGVQKI